MNEFITCGILAVAFIPFYHCSSWGWGDFLFIYGCMGGDDGCTGRMAVCSGVSSVPLWSGAYSRGEFCR